jgi:cytochrome c-type biogenesis protein
MGISPLSLALALLGGLLTVLSPCVLPILPILVGRSLQTHRYAPIFLVAGLIAGFAVAGSLLGIASSWLTGLANFLRILAITTLILLGMLAIFPNQSNQIFSRFKFPFRFNKKFKEPERISLIGEFWLGTQLGLLWTPCAGPALGSIILLAVSSHQILSAFILFLVYGVGAGIPMLAIAYAGKYVSQSLLKLRSRSKLLQRLGGIMMVITAIAILNGWDVQIQLWLAPLFPPLPL